MPDKPKNNFVCRAGPDPSNSITKDAVATIYNNGVSVYHLEQGIAKKHVNELGVIDKTRNLMGSIGLGDPTPIEPSSTRHGSFNHSQRAGSEDRDPLNLRDRVDKLNAQFDGSGKLTGCTLLTLDGHIKIDAVQDLPKPDAPAAGKKADISAPAPMA